MPKPRRHAGDAHVDGNCQCYKQPVAVAQSLAELDYLKSACAAAQQGNLTKLTNILQKHPDAVSSDGTQGTCCYAEL